MATREIVASVSVAIWQGKASAVLVASVRLNLDYLAVRAKVTTLGKGVGSRWGLHLPSNLRPNMQCLEIEGRGLDKSPAI